LSPGGFGHLVTRNAGRPGHVKPGPIHPRKESHPMSSTPAELRAVGPSKARPSKVGLSGLGRAGRAAACGAALCGVVAAGFVGGSGSTARAADPDPGEVARHPEPAAFPVSWDLKFRSAPPKRIVVKSGSSKYPVAYWYITYTVSNLGEKEQDFQPEFDLIASDGKVYAGNRAIPGDVFDAIKRQEGNDLLISPRKVAGMINVGPEQGRDSVAIWEEPMRQMGTFSIYVAGLSGEMVTMKKVGDKFVAVDRNREAEELKDVKEADRLTLRKQLQLTYQVVGDENNAGKDPVMKKGEKYVMR
jgi:hypothetical protein